MKPTFPTSCPCSRPGPQRTLVCCLLQGALAAGVLSHLGGPGGGGWQRSGADGLSSKEKGGWEEAHPAVLSAPCSCGASCPSPLPQFLQFRMKIINLKLERFRDRVEFSGNPSKYDVSVTLRNVQLEDEGTYNCYIMNPPDRHRGHGKIYLQVLMEGEGLLGGPGRSHPAAPQQG